MASKSPLGNLHNQMQATVMTIGTQGPRAMPIELVAVYQSVELEYAALRRRAGLMDLPDRAALRVTGDDSLGFCNNMLTQELQNVPRYGATRSFWLNRKGRIVADFLVVVLDDCLLLECHALAAAHALESLDSYMIADDVAIEDVSASTHRLSLHGPASQEYLATLSPESQGNAIATLAPDRASVLTIAGHEVLAVRQDTLGCTGFELFVPYEGVEAVWAALIGAPQEGQAPPVRPAGWHAWNIARVESGQPMFLLDFSTDSLPHETGVLADRVSFTKGCYLGQEVVARMQARGAWKQEVACLRCDAVASQTPAGEPIQPVTGERVFVRDTDTVIGAVTSSVVSPMLGDTPICFAMMKRDAIQPGALVTIEAQGATMHATIQPTLSSVTQAAG